MNLWNGTIRWGGAGRKRANISWPVEYNYNTPNIHENLGSTFYTHLFFVNIVISIYCDPLGP